MSIVDLSKLIETRNECIICYVEHHDAWNPDVPTEERLDWMFGKTGVPSVCCKEHEVELAAAILRRADG